MSQYYLLKPAVGTKETGKHILVVESYEDYDFNAPNSVYKSDSDFFPNFVPDIRFKLAKYAKLCDVMGGFERYWIPIAGNAISDFLTQ